MKIIRRFDLYLDILIPKILLFKKVPLLSKKKNIPPPTYYLTGWTESVFYELQWYCI